MKKFGVISLMLSSMFFLVVSADAAPVGNIAKPAMLKSIMKSDENAKVGGIVEGEFDFGKDRKIKDVDNDVEFRFLGSKIGAIFENKYIIYGLIGSAYYEEEFTDEGSKVKIESKEDLAWGIGATAILYETKLKDSTLRFGIDGRWRTTDLDIDKVTIDNVVYTIPSGSVTNLSIEYSEWQFAGAASLELGRLFPYIGVKYSNIDATLKATVLGTTYEDNSSKLDSNVGIFAGCDLLVMDSMSINVEGRFIDEEALTLGVAVRF
ncbi:MAG: hypothetical protein V1872_13695 [bacterium]